MPARRSRGGLGGAVPPGAWARPARSRRLAPGPARSPCPSGCGPAALGGLARARAPRQLRCHAPHGLTIGLGDGVSAAISHRRRIRS